MADITNISIDYIDEIDNISINYEDSIDSIDINYLSQIDNISINIGDGPAINITSPVTSVNSLTGDVVLSASAILETLLEFGGVYYYVFDHELGYKYPTLYIFDNDDNSIFADNYMVDENYVTITSVIDLTGYRVVAQR